MSLEDIVLPQMDILEVVSSVTNAEGNQTKKLFQILIILQFFSNFRRNYSYSRTCGWNHVCCEASRSNRRTTTIKPWWVTVRNVQTTTRPSRITRRTTLRTTRRTTQRTSQDKVRIWVTIPFLYKVISKEVVHRKYQLFFLILIRYVD